MVEKVELINVTLVENENATKTAQRIFGEDMVKAVFTTADEFGQFVPNSAGIAFGSYLVVELTNGKKVRLFTTDIACIDPL